MKLSDDHKNETCAEPADGAILPLVQRLLAQMDEREILYCHWKSNDALDRSADGRNDLDLLINQGQSASLAALLGELGFKEAFAPEHQRMPGVLDYFGFDEKSRRLVHVHAHFQLVVGQDLTKNYRIPLEAAFLKHRIRRGIFYTPTPELDYLLYVLRLILKHGGWDVQLLGFGSLSEAERRELAWLVGQVDREKLEQIRQGEIPWLSAVLLGRCEGALEANQSVLNRVRTTAALQRALAPFGRRSALADAAVKIQRRITIGLRRRLLGYRAGRTLAAGGRIVAVVGGDGSGKSTVIEGLSRWLAGELHVERIHMGRPPWSLTTRLIRGLFKAGALLGLTRYVSTQTVLARADEESVRRFPGYALLLRELCISRDRALHYRRAERMALTGALVIADRFPVAELHALDGPVLDKLIPQADRSRFYRWLIARDRSYYQSFRSPDLLLILRLHPDLAAARKEDEESGYVWRRSRDVWIWSEERTDGIILDAEASIEDVLSRAQDALWGAI